MPGTPRPGAHLDAVGGTLSFRVYSARATRLEVWLYAVARGAPEVERLPLQRAAAPAEDGWWSGSLPLAPLLAAHAFPGAVLYGVRAWGPNWPFDPAWTPGSEAGFREDVDVLGNRFDPNKLLLDPYATEVSHDPAPRLSAIDPDEPSADYDTGPGLRAIDTGPLAPKGVVPLAPGSGSAGTGAKPRRPLSEDVVYEVHVRGFTRLDGSLPEAVRGTYRGAGLRAGYLRELGVTAVELLPVQQFASEQNDDGDPRGDNAWGYMTLGYFAPNRRYAADRSPGGPTREFQEMVGALHAEGIKVFLDVVFNHTGEGLLARTTEADDSRGDDARQLPARARLLSLRGLDNATYYSLRSRPDLDGGRPQQRYLDLSACGPALATARPPVRDLVLDALAYWAGEMGVDGFRFDLAPALGNRLADEGFAFDWSDPGSLLRQMAGRLPQRSAATPDGVDLIAEPWAVGEGTYQLGRFPAGWAQWNDVYRQVLRRAENECGVDSVRPWQAANALAGSEQQLRGPPGAAPAGSLNYVSSHDGLTLRDLFSYTHRDDAAWDHGGDAAAQRQAVRSALALLALSAGVPMLQGGDERYRTLGGRGNTVAVDDETVWLDWEGVGALLAAEQAGDAGAQAALRSRDDVAAFAFARAMLRLRAAHPALRPAAFFTGAPQGGGALPDCAWYGADGEALREGWDDPERGFLGYRVAEPGGSIHVAWRWRAEGLSTRLPRNAPGARWRRVADTAAWMEPLGNVDAAPGTEIDSEYYLHPRSVAVFVER